MYSAIDDIINSTRQTIDTAVKSANSATKPADLAKTQEGGATSTTAATSAEKSTTEEESKRPDPPVAPPPQPPVPLPRNRSLTDMWSAGTGGGAGGGQGQEVRSHGDGRDGSAEGGGGGAGGGGERSMGVEELYRNYSKLELEVQALKKELRNTRDLEGKD